jgi:hypothetical protein
MSEKNSSKKRVSKGDKEGEKGTFSQVPNETPSIAKNVIDYTRGERKPLRELIGKIVYIVNVKQVNTNRGIMTILEAYEKIGEKIEEYYTFSRVIARDVERIADLINKGYIVRVKIAQDEKRKYIYFDTPK